jgi:hypothetical protein
VAVVRSGAGLVERAGGSWRWAIVNCTERPGTARHNARHGPALPGTARHGTTRRGKARCGKLGTGKTKCYKRIGRCIGSMHVTLRPV